MKNHIPHQTPATADEQALHDAHLARGRQAALDALEERGSEGVSALDLVAASRLSLKQAHSTLATLADQKLAIQLQQGRRQHRYFGCATWARSWLDANRAPRKSAKPAKPSSTDGAQATNSPNPQPGKAEKRTAGLVDIVNRPIHCIKPLPNAWAGHVPARSAESSHNPMLRPPVMRAGALDFKQHPSRIGQELVAAI